MDTALLNAIRSIIKEEIEPIKKEILEIKEEQKLMKNDISEIKEEQRLMKNDISEIKEEQRLMKKKINAIEEQTSNLTEFKTIVINKLDLISEDQKSIFEIIGEHDVAIRTLRRRPV